MKSSNDENAELTALRRALAASRWPLRMYEDFADNQAGWEVGESEDELSTTRQDVRGGKYRWQAQAREGFGWWSCAPMDALGDFCLTAEARLAEGTAQTEYGVVFRVDGDNCYAFAVREDGHSSVWIEVGEERRTLLEADVNPALRTGEENRLIVVGFGTHFLFLVNEHVVGEVEDATLPHGKVGLTMGLEKAGDSAVVEFGRFEVRAL
jgi:hypothetical protein